MPGTAYPSHACAYPLYDCRRSGRLDRQHAPERLDCPGVQQQLLWLVRQRRR